jgi:hypothetical protein
MVQLEEEIEGGQSVSKELLLIPLSASLSVRGGGGREEEGALRVCTNKRRLSLALP